MMDGLLGVGMLAFAFAVRWLAVRATRLLLQGPKPAGAQQNHPSGAQGEGVGICSLMLEPRT